jgi:Flp pilus assembly protein TadD
MSLASPPPPAGRNAPCPCGSGRKWKQCCGRGGGSADRREAPTTAAAPRIESVLSRAATLVATGDFASAESSLLALLQQIPDEPRALLQLGRLRVLQGRHAAAIGPLRAAAARGPRDPEPHLALAAAHRAARDPAAAEAALRAAAEVAPADHRPWSLLGSLLREGGRADEARTALDRAAALAPGDPMIRLARGGLLNDARQAVEALALLEPLRRTPPDSPSLRGELHAELSRALEATGRYAEAWEAISAANAAQADDPAMKAVDRGRVAAWIEAYQRHLPPGVGPAAEPGSGEVPPDLLVGFPRSGTTMLEQALAAHPDVGTSGERPIVQRLKRTLGRLADDPDAFARRIAAMTASELGELRRRLLRIAREEVPGPHRRILHKHPMDVIELPLLERLVPDARVLYVVRDPRDVFLSCLKQRFVPNMVTVHFLEPAATLALQERVDAAWRAARDRIRTRWVDVRYEAFVADPEAGLRRILDFLDLPWHEGLRAFHEAAATRWISTPSARAVREAPHRRAVGGWRRFETPMAPLLPRLARLAERCGYPEHPPTGPDAAGSA